jgi:hypothetical protein
VDAREYAEMLENPPPATLFAVVGEPAPGAGDVAARLADAGHATSVVASPRVEGVQWELALDDADGDVRVWLDARPSYLATLDLAWHGVTKEDVAAVAASPWIVGVQGCLGDEPLAAYHAFLRLLHAAAPDAGLFFDVDQAAPRPAAWLREVGESDVPPSARSLFTIHSVPENDGPDAAVWLHTHGLDRCGSIDLDIVGAGLDDVDILGELLNAVASLFVDRGVPPPDEPFQAAMGVDLVWLPWEDGVRHVRGAFGGRRERGDEVHGGLRGLLFAPKKGLFGRKYESPRVLVPELMEDPVFFVSGMETKRMTLLARERLDRFRALFERFGGREDEWGFLVKLGYRVDGAEDDTEREHLWFHVHAIEGDEVDATLINEPRWVSALAEGQRGRHPLSLLTDWTILCEHGRFDADSVVALERTLDS